MSPATVTIQNERGMVAMITLMMIAMLLLIGLAAYSASRFGQPETDSGLLKVKTLYAAEAGLEVATASIQTHYDSTNTKLAGQYADCEPVNDCQVTYEIEPVFSDDESLLRGQKPGAVTPSVHSYRIRSRAVGPNEKWGMEVSILLQTTLRPSAVANKVTMISSESDLVIASAKARELDHMTAGAKFAHRQTGEHYSIQADGRVRSFERFNRRLETSEAKITTGNSDILP